MSGASFVTFKNSAPNKKKCLFRHAKFKASAAGCDTPEVPAAAAGHHQDTPDVHAAAAAPVVAESETKDSKIELTNHDLGHDQALDTKENPIPLMKQIETVLATVLAGTEKSVSFEPTVLQAMIDYSFLSEVPTEKLAAINVPPNVVVGIDVSDAKDERRFFQLDLDLSRQFCRAPISDPNLKYLLAVFSLLTHTHNRVLASVFVALVETHTSHQMINWSHKHSVIGKLVDEEINRISDFYSEFIRGTPRNWLVAKTVVRQFLEEKKMYPIGTRQHLCMVMHVCLHAISVVYGSTGQTPVRNCDKLLRLWCRDNGFNKAFFTRFISLFESHIKFMLSPSEQKTFSISAIAKSFGTGEDWCRMVEPAVIKPFSHIYAREELDRHYTLCTKSVKTVSSVFFPEKLLLEKDYYLPQPDCILPLHVFYSSKIDSHMAWLCFPLYSTLLHK